MSWDDDDDDRGDSRESLAEREAREQEREKTRRFHACVDTTGRLNEEGIKSIRLWAMSLVHDPTARLTIFDLKNAFESDDYYGFSLPVGKDYEGTLKVFDTAVEAGFRMSETASDAEYEARISKRAAGKDDDDDEDRPYLTVREDDGRKFSDFHARLPDDLGSQPFTPEVGDTKPEYLIEGLVPLRGVSMFVSLPEALKTWVAYYVAICVARGAPCFGRATKKASVAIINFEMDPTEPQRRLSLLGARADDHILVVNFPNYALTHRKFWKELTKLQRNFVVVDSLS